MTVYYVSTFGNDLNPGTQDQPFKTLYKGINIATYGDIIHVFPGKYTPSFSERIIIDKSISVIGDDKTNTVIDGSNIKEWETDWKQGLVEIKANNVTFSGFTVQNVIAGETGQGASGITIYPLYRDRANIQNIIVEKNYINNIWSSGIQIYGSLSESTWVKNAIIRYNELDKICYGGDPNKDRQEALSLFNVVDFQIYYNYIHNSGYTPTGNIHYGGEGIDIGGSSNNGKLYNNYVYDTRSVGIYLNGSETYTTNLEVYNNIIEKTYNFDNPNELGTGIGLANERGGYIQGLNIHDNIAYNNKHGLVIYVYHNTSYPYNPIGISDVAINNNIIHIGGIDIGGCNEILHNIVVKDNYSTIYVQPCYSDNVNLFGNITNIDQITNIFNSTYENLRTDILTQVGNPYPTTPYPTTPYPTTPSPTPTGTPTPAPSPTGTPTPTPTQFPFPYTCPKDPIRCIICNVIRKIIGSKK